jgi:hypothetical protein
MWSAQSLTGRAVAQRQRHVLTRPAVCRGVVWGRRGVREAHTTVHVLCGQHGGLAIQEPFLSAGRRRDRGPLTRCVESRAPAHGKPVCRICLSKSA